MNAEVIAQSLDAEVVCGKQALDTRVEMAFASDLMSDVLTLKADNVLLITGLSNLQTIRTAEMSDIRVIILARNKKASAEMLEIAEDLGIVLIECSYSMFKCCGLLFTRGIRPVY
jgi:hypothetical protein